MLYLVFDSAVSVLVVCVAKSFFLFHSISFVLLVGRKKVFISLDFFSTSLSLSCFRFVLPCSLSVCAVFLICAKVYYCFYKIFHQIFTFISIDSSARSLKLFRSCFAYSQQKILLFLWDFLTPNWCPWKSAPCLCQMSLIILINMIFKLWPFIILFVLFSWLHTWRFLRVFV